MRFSFRQLKQGAALLALALLIGHVFYAPSPRKQQTKPAVQLTSAKDVITYSSPSPSEVQPNKGAYASTAGATEPKYITLPTIQTEGYIQKMGVDQHNQVAAPNNVNLAGWYVNSLSPGQAGLSIIDGHVNGLHGPGIFLHLGKLSAGDAFTIELGNGTKELFRIKQIIEVRNEVAGAALFARDNSIKSQLNLITCAGDFDNATHSYNQRTIVVSELISAH